MAKKSAREDGQFTINVQTGNWRVVSSYIVTLPSLPPLPSPPLPSPPSSPCHSDCPLFHGLKAEQQVLLTHGDSIETVPEKELKVVAKSGSLVAAVQHKEKPIFGVQFHPEVDLTVNGKEMLKNFLFKVSLNA